MEKYTVPMSKEVYDRRHRATAMARYSIAKNIVKYRKYKCTVSEFMEHPERYERS